MAKPRRARIGIEFGVMAELGSVSVDAAKQAPAAGAQGSWDERRRGRDETRAVVMGGVAHGLSGDERRALAAGWGIGAVIVLAVTIFNILTRRHDYPGQNLLYPLWDEGSSALTTLVAFAIPAAVAVWTRCTAPSLWSLAPVHVVGTVAYSAVHVGGFVLLRTVGFALLDMPYRFGPIGAEAPYEFGKDIVAYAIAVGAFWLMLRWSWPPVADAAAPEPQWFDIRDGARLVRTPLAEVVAVRSAGNYVEFLLSDGRRPLMRGALGRVEAELTPSGFVRTHRSWLVNSARVTGLRPEGSGDYVVELGALEAPLSRRWREALDVLRS
jgi:DNA-binding LytR/AlgR family response regulator